MTRTIPLKIQNEYIVGDKVLIGAAGSHNDVVLQMEFSPMWEGLAKTVQFRDALEESTIEVILTADLLEDDSTTTYLVPVPNGAKKYAGKMTLAVKGATALSGKETRATLAVYGQFIVKESQWDEDAETEQDVPATQAEQLQRQIDAVLATIADARAAAKEAEKSKGAAAGSASAAATSAQNAAASAATASSKAAEASSAAGSAANSASAAARSATDAASSKTAAAGSAGAAATSAQDASVSAATASNKASEASASASNAASSASAAAGSATDAAGSASEAANSAAAAGQSASAASDSADTAAQYALISIGGTVAVHVDATTLVFTTKDQVKTYGGTYEVDAPVGDSLTLETENSFLTDDMKINPTPMSETSNPSGGKTLLIGG